VVAGKKVSIALKVSSTPTSQATFYLIIIVNFATFAQKRLKVTFFIAGKLR